MEIGHVMHGRATLNETSITFQGDGYCAARFWFSHNPKGISF